jgi:hypothetical protein
MLTRLLPVLASGLVIVALSAERLSLLPTKSSVEYHARVKLLADQFPLRFGHWIGEDVPVTSASRKMLNANVVISRNYRNISSGTPVSYLFVQGKDARALMDHYPPICYVAGGYDKDLSRAADWQIGPLGIRGTEYEFTRRDVMSSRSILVDNFIIMPDGRIERDMQATKSAAADVYKRFFGAAQVQLVFDRRVSPAEHQAAIQDFLMECQPLIKVVQSGLPS